MHCSTANDCRTTSRLLKNYFETCSLGKVERAVVPIGGARRVFKKTVQRGRSEQRGESYSAPYVESLSDARTMLEDLFQHPATGESRRS